MTNRVCNKCKIPKQLDSFPKNKRFPLGRAYTCSLCMKDILAAYRKDNPEKRRQTVKNTNDRRRKAINKWKRENKDKMGVYRTRRRAVKKGNGGSHTVAEWRAILSDANHACKHCGRTDVKLTKDHIIPLTKGGTDNASNLQPLCFSCNSRKGNRYEW